LHSSPLPVAQPDKWAPDLVLGVVPMYRTELSSEMAAAIEVFVKREYADLSLKHPELTRSYNLRIEVHAAIDILAIELNVPQTMVREGSTAASALDALNAGAEPVGMAESYDVEGKNSTSGQWLRMIWQCILANRCLAACRTLDPASIISAHGLLMCGAQGDGSPTEHTETGYRTHEAYGRSTASCYQYVPPGRIASSMEQVAKTFEKNVLNESMHPAEVCAGLVCRFLQVHPFANGNGRMCRLLFAYAARRCGFPLQSTLQPIRDKKYMQAIVKAQQGPPTSGQHPMNYLCLSSLMASARNASAYLGAPASADE
jgi:hypothetical protein